jgi:SOS response regulatory protein OraA/RecX
MIKNFVVKQMLKRKGVPANQIDMIMELMNKDPDLFKKIADEVDHKVKHEKKGQQQASMEVMKKYAPQIRDLMGK